MSYFVDIHTHHKTQYNEVISLYSYRLGYEFIPKDTSNTWCGIHPWDVDNVNISMLDTLRKMDIFGIGEIGIDLYKHQHSGAQQKYWLDRQMDIAIERGIPVVLHLVRTNDYAITALKRYSNKVPGMILHGFTGAPQLAESYIKAGALLSFSRKALSSQKTIQTIKNISLDNMLLESDDEQYDIKTLYKSVAILKECDILHLKEKLYENYKKLAL